jgi:predicted  nucleic acid-binding Zn-ribbon protein
MEGQVNYLENVFAEFQLRLRIPPDAARQMQEKITALRKIQKAQREKLDIAKLKHRAAQLKEQFEAQKAGLKILEEKYKVTQVDHKSLEVDLRGQEDAIARANAQLSQLKTNKEYTAKMSEIEGFKANRSIFEEKILLSFDVIDAIKASIDKEKAALAEDEKKYLSEKKVVEDSVKILEDKVSVLTAQRNQIVPLINKAHLSRYERVLNHKAGVAIVPVKSGSCGGCYMNVPAQVINEIKMHDHLVFCEICARILYLEDDL